MALKCFLIRHGQTEWSLSGQHTGRTDLPMTAQGMIQASRLAPILGAIQFSTVISSPLKRVKQTCELAGLSSGSQIDPALVEWNYGDYEGLTSAEIHKVNPDWNLFVNGAPRGEAPEDVSERVDRVIESLLLLSGNVAIFSHGHLLSTLAARWIGLPIKEAQHFELATSSISTIGYSSSHPGVRVISSWNLAI